MTPPTSVPDETADLPVAEEPPEDQVSGMATEEDLAGAEEESD